MTPIKFYKEPTAILDYSIDWSDFLTGGDTIVSSTWSTSDIGIVVDSNTYTTNTTTVWLSGGVDGYNYVVTNSIVTQLGREDSRYIEITALVKPNSVSKLIRLLRMQLGDTEPSSYRYMNEWLSVALESSVNALQRWWGDRYIMDETGGYIIRNPAYAGTFLFSSPPEIQERDIRPIILMASILVKSGSLESNSWNTGSWKDAEIAVSNIEGSRGKQFGLGLDWEELKMYILPPTKRLSGAVRIAHPSTEE